jgi:hypothetical protein
VRDNGGASSDASADGPHRDTIAAARVSGDEPIGETVGEVSTLYLGNILYAIERCALGLDGENKPSEAAFYRGLGRKLAEAYGRAKRA